jgi:hypothetical protein
MPTHDSSHLAARVAAHTRWAQTDNRTAATAPARMAFLARFERQVDPGSQLTPLERARRADHARKAYFARLALASARSRASQSASGTPPRTRSQKPADGHE